MGKAVSMGAILAAVARILSDAQQAKLKIWIAETLPRTTREIGAWIEAECGISYESRSGPIALLHPLGMEHRKPSPPP